MMYLEKEDCSIYYEVQGEGEPLILIHGVMVDGDLYQNTAQILGKYFRVITFDRRGNSRSICREERIFSMESQVEDIRDLMDELRIDSAYFVGASAGAVIGSCFLQHYPGRVRHLIMYEPAMLGKMMDEEDICRWVEEMNDLIRRKKYMNAVLRFAQHIASSDPRSPKKKMEVSMREMGNYEYALTREFPGLVAYQPNMEILKKHADKIAFAAGEKSGETVYARAAGKLAEEVGTRMVYYPGYHNLPYDLPFEFAVCILGTLLLTKTAGTGNETQKNKK